jgi:hypothetical protein
MISKPIAIAVCLAAAPALAQCPVQRLSQPADLVTFFGTSVTEIEGDHLIVADNSAYTACSTPDPFRCSGGAAFAYRWNGLDWTFIQQIVPFDVGLYDGFGSSVDIDGDRMLVVTVKRDFDGSKGYFHEYIYNADAGQWIETSRTLGPGITYDQFGLTQIAADGSLALVGQGPLIHRYTQDAEGWVYRDSFESPDGTARDTFGQTIKLEGDWAFITARYDDSASPPTRHGSVYVLHRQPDDTLEFVQKLLPPGVGEGEPLNFGDFIDFDGETLAVSMTGATIDHPEQGVVYLYELDGDQWTLRQTVTHSDAGRQWYPGGFGRGVSIDGDTMVAGTAKSLDFRFAYAFRRATDGQWHEAAVLATGEATPEGWVEDEFGLRTEVQGDRVLVASEDRMRTPPFTKTGAVYAFDLGCEICEPDLDADGALTVFDFLTYLNLFQDGDPLADFDGDGELTIFDFLAFQTAFDAGCE